MINQYQIVSPGYVGIFHAMAQLQRNSLVDPINLPMFCFIIWNSSKTSIVQGH